jgi:hypothetical protein
MNGRQSILVFILFVYNLGEEPYAKKLARTVREGVIARKGGDLLSSAHL